MVKVDIFPSGIRKKSCGDQLRSSSATDTVLKDAAAEDDSLISRIGCRGRAKGQFINPQVSIMVKHLSPFIWSSIQNERETKMCSIGQRLSNTKSIQIKFFCP